ncbi:hypothetical protein O6H91_18G056100 [Diphasiastrum complanatum]|uniref:Uncharacterized protein n=5 Tax=Diphasiastrum complanatum TaxID=34168 RepID=A0ACC2B1H4_DIPCM|nr:hypothetical protein O6H91_18G056100 [Diphasiastrum complanatum]KAJ7523628.1 hypothetical protein O6H91_18G056100 [Diphasiastrum complanatum]KAJ7523629.1 hypothetical protein O6H91_18G056100 [Diphasiastrum complanatum]KAJ7523635.1 hypothetical protein O6H91_18G056100 [Diphasiastrum complanatum]KAJ7523636.1 hypothetical protein O6H91_18G056100 [Diphasiastrum complanatum]
MKCCTVCRLSVVMLQALMIISHNSRVLSYYDRACDCQESFCACNLARRLVIRFLHPPDLEASILFPEIKSSGQAPYVSECPSPSPARLHSPSERFHISCSIQGFRRLLSHAKPQHHHHHQSPRPLRPSPIPVPLISPMHPFPPSAMAPSSFSNAPSPSKLFPVPSPIQEPSSSPGTSVISPHSSYGSPPLMSLPPSMPNMGCQEICADPYASSPPGSPCGCVIPIQVGLEFEIELYILFRLVSKLSDELAAGTYLSQSQVRIIGANAVSENLDRTQVAANLVPLNEAFDTTTVVLTAQRFWSHQITINETLFGNYSVLFVNYPGLPPSHPSQAGNASDTNGSMGDPNYQQLGIGSRSSYKIGSGVITAISLSSAVAVVTFLAVIWLLLTKRGYNREPAVVTEVPYSSPRSKKSVGGSTLSSSLGSSPSISLVSGFGIYTGSAKTYALADLEKATNRFSSQNIIGKGGFGQVYHGVLDDHTEVAVKVLTRDDKQGGREFTAEVEMLSRLHHRNLVKLMGICTEQHTHCLVYELITNGSVESHLHGADKEVAPLEWESRLKIAVGAARGLAYLHEDSNPRVIHRDFKASNILLEDDFTPKVSDFGLARAACDHMSGHISTRVMGTFGYVAPEYAMTGHLLVKSDVYSYGVVLLELLSGRKPVDMNQPPGQENLVTWARTLLNSREGLGVLVDPTLRDKVPFDGLSKVAAIASMCVEPEVSHRPFMGEVVQALKLLYNDSDASDGPVSGNPSSKTVSLSRNGDARGPQENSDTKFQYGSDGTSFVSIDYDSGPFNTLDSGKWIPSSAILSISGRFMRRFSGSFRRLHVSGSLKHIRSKPACQRSKHPVHGALSEQTTPLHHDPGVRGSYSDRWH